MLGLLFLFMGVLSLVSLAATEKTSTSHMLPGWWMFSLGGFLIILSIFFNKKILQIKRLNYTLRLLELVTLILLLVYTFRHELPLQLTYISTALLALILTTLWEKRSARDTEIKMDDKGITIHHFLRSKKLSWSEIQRVIFKHGIITIDCRNNRLYQYPLSSGTLSEADRQGLAFAEKSIQEHADRYQGDW